MGRLHARLLAESWSADLTVVADKNWTRAKEVAATYGARPASVEELVDDTSVSACVVAVPDRNHVEVAEPLLRAGKAVLVEKPLATSVGAARRLAEAGRMSRLMVGHVLRFDPRYAAARASVRNGDVGDVVHVMAGRLGRRSLGGRGADTTLAHHLGVHDIDAIQWISGQRIERVYAHAASSSHSVQDTTHDALLVACDLSGGAVASLHAGWYLPPELAIPRFATFLAGGTSGLVQVGAEEQGIRVFNHQAGCALPETVTWATIAGCMSGSLEREVAHFLHALDSNTDFVPSLEDALDAVAVADAIEHSLRSGQPESVSPFRGAVGPINGGLERVTA